MIDTLADLHAMQGLEALGKPAGFVARQIRGWTERWHGSKTSDVPEMEQLALWLEQRLPPRPSRPARGDGGYKLGNGMLGAAALRRPGGGFAWGRSAVGEPVGRPG